MATPGLFSRTRVFPQKPRLVSFSFSAFARTGHYFCSHYSETRFYEGSEPRIVSGPNTPRVSGPSIDERPNETQRPRVGVVLDFEFETLATFKTVGANLKNYLKSREISRNTRFYRIESVSKRNLVVSRLKRRKRGISLPEANVTWEQTRYRIPRSECVNFVDRIRIGAISVEQTRRNTFPR